MTPCPNCGEVRNDTRTAHVENDRIAWWSCDTCGHCWARRFGEAKRP